MRAFSAHTWSFHDLTLLEAFGTIARLGFRWVDIGSGPNLNALKAAANPERAADEINADLALYDLAVSDLYLLLPRICSEDEERRSKERELFSALLPLAQAIRAPGITVSPGLATPTAVDDAPATAALDRAAESLRAMLAEAQAAGLRLSIEPHLDSIAPTPEQALALLAAVPGLELTLDWADLTYQNFTHEQIAALLPHARHLHIRQTARRQLQSTFERGRIDLRRFIDELIAANYTGTICIETLNMPGRHGAVKINPLIETVRLRDALRDLRDAARR
ncbi:MAG: sugar phosphate isomerase/epimerase [Aggregatilineales bacterium]